MNKLIQIYEKLAKLYNDEERGELDSRYKLWTEQYDNCYAALNGRIDEICMIGRQQNPTTTETVAARSSRTSRSSRSSRSSVMAKIVSKHAQLKTELSFLEIEKEKEMELKRIQMTKELAAHEAAIEAVEKLDIVGENVERGTATGSCKPPEQVQSPLERVHKYVKEQSDSLQPSEPFGNASDTSPRISEWNLTAHPFIPSSILPTSTVAFQGPASLHHPSRLPNTTALPRATSFGESFPHHGFYQPNLVYSTPFSTINPTSSSEYPRVTVPTPLSCSNDAMHLQRNPQLPVPSQRVQSDDPLTRLADLLTERQSRDKLPLPEPEIFRGDLMHFPRWIKSFETIIENQTQKTSERLFYLAKYTAGEAKDAIKGYISQNNTDAYAKAKGLLWK